MAESKPRTPRYMTQQEVADELRFKSPGSVRNLINAGLLVGVNTSSVRGSSRLVVTRESFERYCERIEAEAAQRFGPAA